MTSPAAENPHDTISDMIRFGVIHALDGVRASVSIAGLVTPALPMILLAGGFALWIPPTPGEQVVVLCPNGDITGGFILRGIPCDAFPAPGGDAIAVLRMPDAATIAYDPDAHVLAITLPTGKIILTAPEFDFTGDVKVTGKLDVSEVITSANDVVAGTVHLKTHVHKDTKPEVGSFSGVPKP